MPVSVPLIQAFCFCAVRFMWGAQPVVRRGVPVHAAGQEAVNAVISTTNAVEKQQ
jgi:hypothetical protein